MERRLVGMLAADVVGYSRLLSKDDAGTRPHFTAVRKELLASLVAGRHVRIVKLIGDSLLVAFGSVVGAIIG